MTSETSPTDNNLTPEEQQDNLESSSVALAFVLHAIKLNEAVNTLDFEKFMIHEIFPTVDTRGLSSGNENFKPDQHFLLGGREADEYVWMVRLEYFVHQTPRPTWLHVRGNGSFEGVKNRIEKFGKKISTEILYDVKEWHQRLGLS
jgi:hypothetical protein